jgi:multidrug efflux pump subunit AcrA (membrane-fusion protein)
VVVVVISSTVGYSVVCAESRSVAVQSGRVLRQDLTQTVSANGEIKPKKYVNVSSNMMGRIVGLPVKEGDRVREASSSFSSNPFRAASRVTAAEASLDAASNESRECLHRSGLPKRQPQRQRPRSLDPKPTLSRQSRTSIARTECERKACSPRERSIGQSGLRNLSRSVERFEGRLSQAEAQMSQVLKQRDARCAHSHRSRAGDERARSAFESDHHARLLMGSSRTFP